MLVNKLATVMLKTGRQYNCHIKETDSETESLIQVLSLQVITQSKIRLTADDLVSFREVFESFSQKTAFFDVFIREIAFFDSLIKKSTFFDNLNAREKKLSILNLIKNAQEFDLLCRQISSQFCRKLQENFLFVLIKNEILKKMNHVFVSKQKII